MSAKLAITIVLLAVTGISNAQDFCGVQPGTPHQATSAPIGISGNNAAAACTGEQWVSQIIGSNEFERITCTSFNGFQTGSCPDGSNLVGTLNDFSFETQNHTFNCRTQTNIGVCEVGELVDGQCTVVNNQPDCICENDGAPFNFDGIDSCTRDLTTQCTSETSCEEVACNYDFSCPAGQDVDEVFFTPPNGYTKSCATDGLACLGGETSNGPIIIECDADEPDCVEIGPTESYGQGTSDGSHCTADFYTDPVTGEVVCGTYQSQYANGDVVSTSTDSNGTVTTSTVTAETNTAGETITTNTTTQTFTDGSSTTSVTTTNQATGTSTTSTSNGSGFGNTSAGPGNDSNCPSNSYVLHGGVLVCSSLTPSNETGTESNRARSNKSCDVAPTCSGDQIQCQILYQQWLTRCEASGEEEEISSQGFLEQAGLDYEQDSFQRFTQDLGGVVLDASGFLPASQTCPAPYTFQIKDRTFEISWNLFCDFAGMLSFLVVGLAYFMGAKIILNSF